MKNKNICPFNGKPCIKDDCHMWIDWEGKHTRYRGCALVVTADAVTDLVEYAEDEVRSRVI